MKLTTRYMFSVVKCSALLTLVRREIIMNAGASRKSLTVNHGPAMNGPLYHMAKSISEEITRLAMVYRSNNLLSVGIIGHLPNGINGPR